MRERKFEHAQRKYPDLILRAFVQTQSEKMHERVQVAGENKLGVGAGGQNAARLLTADASFHE